MGLADIVKRIEINLYGERNFPVGRVVVPENLIPDYHLLLRELRKLHPNYDHENLIRVALVKGLDSIRRAIKSGGALSAPGKEYKITPLTDV